MGSSAKWGGRPGSTRFKSNARSKLPVPFVFPFHSSSASNLEGTSPGGTYILDSQTDSKAHRHLEMARSPSPNSDAHSRSPSPTTTRAAMIEKLKVLARDYKVSRILFGNGHSEHYRAFSRAILNVLSTELALFTFAQIIDGLPTADVAWDRRYPHLVGIHPIEQHEDICPGVLDRARRFREDFDPCILSFDPKVRPLSPLADHVIYPDTAGQALRSFRRATPGSRLFNIRLIELVAVSMHEIGALLFQLGLRLHDGNIESIDQWNERPPDATYVEVPPRPTLFNHHGYLADDVYPDGVADIVGYWAEDRILGGVTVFDRNSKQQAPEIPPNVYFHSCRALVTKRYYQLRDDQQQALMDFLLAEHPDSSTSPLPILADNQNLVRVNAEAAILGHFYRDVWERKPPTEEHLKIMQSVPRGVGDYPEYEGFINHVNTFPTVTITMPPRPRLGEFTIVVNDQKDEDSGRGAEGEGEANHHSGVER